MVAVAVQALTVQPSLTPRRAFGSGIDETNYRRPWQCPPDNSLIQSACIIHRVRKPVPQRFLQRSPRRLSVPKMTCTRHRRYPQLCSHTLRRLE